MTTDSFQHEIATIVKERREVTSCENQHEGGPSVTKNESILKYQTYKKLDRKVIFECISKLL